MIHMTKKTNHYLKALAALAAPVIVTAGLLAASAMPAQAGATFTVRSASDQPDLTSQDFMCDANPAPSVIECTLRAAITQANANAGPDTINFDMPGGAAYHTISPDLPLPQITDPVTIDGYTQPDARANTLAKGNDAVLKIELNGTDTSAPGLQIKASDSVIRGLVINRFSNSGIQIDDTADRARVEGNFIGTDVSGTLDLGNGIRGVDVDGASEVLVGGTSPEARNVISGNDQDGVRISDGSYANKVQGNYIGTNENGTGSVGNAHFGVSISGAHGNRVGDTTAQGSNTIAFNGLDGVSLQEAGSGGNANSNAVRRNSIYANGGKGIALGSGGPPIPNDPGDADEGPNRLQNRPAITSAKTSGTGTTIKGRLNSTPETEISAQTFQIQFYSNPSGTNEGKRFIGSKFVGTNTDGIATFTFKPKRKVAAGLTITATATNNNGNTSEFSAPRPVVAQ